MAARVGTIRHVKHEAFVAIRLTPVRHFVKRFIVGFMVRYWAHQQVGIRRHALRLVSRALIAASSNAAHMCGMALLIIVGFKSGYFVWCGEIGQCIAFFSGIAYHLETTFALVIMKHDMVRVETIVEHTYGYPFSCVGLLQVGAQLYFIYARSFMCLI